MVRVMEQRVACFVGANAPVVVGHDALSSAIKRTQIRFVNHPLGLKARDERVAHCKQMISLARFRTARFALGFQLGRAEIWIV